MNKEYLEKILKTKAPSGLEMPLEKLVMEELKPYSEEVLTHHSGNLMNSYNLDSKNQIMLVAHADEIGLMITTIDNEGYLNVTKAGGIRPYVYIGQQVTIVTKDLKHVPGVVGIKKGVGKKEIEVSDLFIDLGVDSKEEALKLVSPGDYVILDKNFTYLANNRLTSRALDDKIGVFIITEAYKLAKELKTKNGCSVLTSVGEETTMRGSSFGVKMKKPTCAIIVDVTYTTDTYGVGEGEVYLGKGPVICHSTIVNKKLNQKLMEVAKKHDINLQYEIAVSRTCTDADKIYYDDTPVALLSIPLRYMHSPAEVVDLNDVKDMINLLAYFILEYDLESLNPYL